jgi:hypothetical protein
MLNQQKEFLKKITEYFPDSLYYTISQQPFLRTSLANL